MSVLDDTIQQGVTVKYVTMATIHEAFVQWQQDVRNGKCLSYEEADALPDNQTALERAEWFWGEL